MSFSFEQLTYTYEKPIYRCFLLFSDACYGARKSKKGACAQ